MLAQLQAYDVLLDGIYYDLNLAEKQAIVTKREGASISNPYSGDVTIPSSITINEVTYTVTSIADYAFMLSYNLNSVSLPNTITRIGEAAFSGCSLTSIDIPNSVSRIDGAAFADCVGLTSITIPSSVTSIGHGFVSGCSSLKYVTCLAVQVPVSENFDPAFDASIMDMTLKVPEASLAAYRSADPWKFFRNIEGIASPSAQNGQFIGDLNHDGKISVEDMTMMANIILGKQTAELVTGDFNFVSCGKYLWVPGNANGWNINGSCRLYSSECNGFYAGYIYVDGDFRLVGQEDWDGLDLGSAQYGILCTDKSSHFNLPKGVYYMEVNMLSMTYSAIKIENMNIAASNNGWNVEDPTSHMTWNAESLCFELTNTQVDEMGWMFVANGSWDFDLGGVPDRLEPHGDILKASGSKIRLYPCRNAKEQIYCTVE